MKILINGKETPLGSEVSIAQLLVQQDVKNTQMVSVQRNGEFVQRDDFDAVTVKDNDQVDFLYFMGGGSE